MWCYQTPAPAERELHENGGRALFAAPFQRREGKWPIVGEMANIKGASGIQYLVSIRGYLVGIARSWARSDALCLSSGPSTRADAQIFDRREEREHGRPEGGVGRGNGMSREISASIVQRHP